MVPIIIHEDLKIVLEKAKENKNLTEIVEQLEGLELDEEGKEYINYLSIAKDDDSKLSYLNKKKIEALDHTIFYDVRTWEPSYRIMAKPGKVLKMLIPTVSDVIMEKFSAVYKTQASVCGECLDANVVRIVSGEDIRKYYHHDYYETEDSVEENNNSYIHESCMKHRECQPWLDLYVKNKDVVSMAIINTNNNMISCRCILWSTGGKTYYDRIYAINNDVNRHMQACLEKLGMINISEKNIIGRNNSIILKIKLEYGQDELESFPYCDTMCYLDGNIISNEYFNDCVELHNTDSTYEGQSHYCSCCDSSVDEDDLHYIERGSNRGSSMCDDCCGWSDYHDCYIADDDSTITNYDGRIIADDVQNLWDGKTCHEDNALELWNGEYAHNSETILKSSEGDEFVEGDKNFEEIEGIYYNINSEEYAEKMEPA